MGVRPGVRRRRQSEALDKALTEHRVRHSGAGTSTSAARPTTALIWSRWEGVVDVTDEATALRRRRVIWSAVADVANANPLLSSRLSLHPPGLCPSGTCLRRSGPSPATVVAQPLQITAPTSRPITACPRKSEDRAPSPVTGQMPRRIHGANRQNGPPLNPATARGRVGARRRHA